MEAHILIGLILYTMAHIEQWFILLWCNVALLDKKKIFSPQVVQSGGKNIELAIIRRNQPLKVITLVYYFFLSLHLNAKVENRIVLRVFPIMAVRCYSRFFLIGHLHFYTSFFLANCFFCALGRSWRPKKSRPLWRRLKKRRRKRLRRRSRRNPLKAVNHTRHFLWLHLRQDSIDWLELLAKRV